MSGRRHGHACLVSCHIARLSGVFRCVDVWTCVGCMCDSWVPYLTLAGLPLPHTSFYTHATQSPPSFPAADCFDA